MDINKLREELKRDEGFRRKPYKDTMGYWTVGYGHFLGKDIPSSELKEISNEQAEELLTKDLSTAFRNVLVLCSDYRVSFNELSDARQRVLVNMCFNLGAAGLSKFKRMWSCISDKDWKGASEEMMESSWSKQVKGRAARLATRMKEG